MKPRGVSVASASGAFEKSNDCREEIGKTLEGDDDDEDVEYYPMDTAANGHRSVVVDLSELNVHGVRRMLTPSGDENDVSTCRRALWFIILLLSAAAFIYTTIDCVSFYWPRNTYTRFYAEKLSLEAESASKGHQPSLPSITVCNLNPIRLTEAARRNWPVLSREPTGNVNLSAWSNVNVSSYEVFRSGAHLLDKLLLSCAGDDDTSCNAALNWTRTWTSVGLCYTLHTTASRVHLTLNAETYENTALSRYGTGLLLLLDAVDQEERRSPGYIVRRHGSEEGGVLLGPGIHAEVIVEPNIDVSLPTQSRDSRHCLSSCYTSSVESRCACRPFWAWGQTNDVRFPDCNIRQHWMCVERALDEMLGRSPSSMCSECTSSHNGWHWRHTYSSLTTSSQNRLASNNVSVSNVPLLLPMGLVGESRLLSMLSDGCRSAELRAITCPMTSRSDAQLVARLTAALDDVADSVEQLRAGLTRTESDIATVMEHLQPRIAFHLQVGLASVRKSFVEGFASAFEIVRERSLWPLVGGHVTGTGSAGGHETVAQLERTVKQLTFTPITETVARKVLYFMADNVLSGKLEIAIQSLDNLTKVYYAFLNSEPLQSSLHVTPEGRYDLHLVPYSVLASCQDALKRCYTGISENVAGLIETILALKSQLKDVYTLNTVNETAMTASQQAFLRRTHQIRQFTHAFHTQVVQRSLDAIETRSDELKRLNRTLSNDRLALASRLRYQLHTVDTTHAHALADIRSWVDDVITVLRREPDFEDPVAARRLSLLAGRVTWSSITSMQAAADALRFRGVEIRALWRTFSGTVSEVWRKFFEEELLRNFYLNLYNDVSGIVKHPGRLDILRTLLASGRLAFPPTLSAPGSSAAVNLRYQPTDLYAALNADIAIIDMAAKMATIDREFRLFEAQSDAEVVLGHRPDNALADIHRQLADRLKTFTAIECQLNNEVVSNNVIDVDIVTSTKVPLTNHAASFADTETVHWLTLLLSHVGGLLALFLGASLITCFEIVDVIIRCCRCGCNKQKSTSTYSSATGGSHINHVITHLRTKPDNAVRNSDSKQSSRDSVNQNSSMAAVESNMRTSTGLISNSKHSQHFQDSCPTETDI